MRDDPDFVVAVVLATLAFMALAGQLLRPFHFGWRQFVLLCYLRRLGPARLLSGQHADLFCCLLLCLAPSLGFAADDPMGLYASPARAEAPPPPPNRGRWFLQVHGWLLRMQMRGCDDLAEANPALGRACRDRLLMAHDYLVERAAWGPMPELGWSQCVEVLSADMTAGAHCVAAAERICRRDGRGDIADPARCTEVMGSGAWMANPDALPF